MGFDSVETVNIFGYTSYLSILDRAFSKLAHGLFSFPRIISYKRASSFFISEQDYREEVIPTIVPNWDHSPRTGRNGIVFHNSNPVLFSEHLLQVKDCLDKKIDPKPFVFIKSWNEWAEGNYLEPDLRFGRQYLEAIKNIFG